MSSAVEYFEVVMTGLGSVYETIRPFKEAIFGLCVIVGGGLAAFNLGYRRQARRPEEALSEAANSSGRSTMTRLHADDRDLLEGMRESLGSLTRAVNRLREALPRGDGAT